MSESHATYGIAIATQVAGVAAAANMVVPGVNGERDSIISATASPSGEYYEGTKNFTVVGNTSVRNDTGGTLVGQTLDFVIRKTDRRGLFPDTRQ